MSSTNCAKRTVYLSLRAGVGDKRRAPVARAAGFAELLGSAGAVVAEVSFARGRYSLSNCPGSLEGAGFWASVSELSEESSELDPDAAELVGDGRLLGVGLDASASTFMVMASTIC